MDLVLFGMQGSGKGTQSKAIAEHCNLVIFETGAELRRLSSEDSELAQKVKAIIESGNLVPTEVVMEIITDFLHKLPAGKNALFDGIPRSDDQKEQFDALMTKEGRSFKGLLIELTEAEAVKRLTTRRMCPTCKTIFPAAYEKETCEHDGSTLITRQDDTPRRHSRAPRHLPSKDRSSDRSLQSRRKNAHRERRTAHRKSDSRYSRGP